MDKLRQAAQAVADLYIYDGDVRFHHGQYGVDAFEALRAALAEPPLRFGERNERTD